MRYEILLRLDKPELDIEYRSKILSLFKSILTNYQEGRFFSEFYDKGSTNKGICFAVQFVDPVFYKEKITLASTTLKLTIAVEQQRTAFIFLNAFLNMRNKTHPISTDNAVIIESIRPIEERIVHGDMAVYHFLSPLCLRLHERSGNKDTYISCKHDNFVSVLIENIRSQVPTYNVGLLSSLNTLQVEASQCKKTVVKHYGCSIEVTIGTIVFQGDTPLLNYIGKMNLGSRKSAGFGLTQLCN